MGGAMRSSMSVLMVAWVVFAVMCVGGLVVNKTAGSGDPVFTVRFQSSGRSCEPSDNSLHIDADTGRELVCGVGLPPVVTQTGAPSGFRGEIVARATELAGDGELSAADMRAVQKLADSLAAANGYETSQASQTRRVARIVGIMGFTLAVLCGFAIYLVGVVSD
jgi:hypothetical protein